MKFIKILLFEEVICTDSTLPVVYSAGEYYSKNHFTKESEGAVSKLRTVAEYEIEFFMENGGTAHINGSSFPIECGCVLCAGPGDKRQSTLHFKSRFVHFGCADGHIADLLSHIPKYSHIPDAKKYSGMFGDIIKASKSLENHSDIEASAKLMLLLCSLCRDTLGQSVLYSGKPYRKASVTDAIDYIKNHYAEPITVEDIAGSCNLSSSYFYRLFLKAVMVSPNRYLLDTRLAAAKTMLTSDNRPLSAVADCCGFNSQAYFSYCFKKSFGMTPKEYRERFGYGSF